MEPQRPVDAFRNSDSRRRHDLQLSAGARALDEDGPARVTSTPFNSRVMPIASVSLPGPEHKSSTRFTRGRRRNISSIPATGSRARINTQPADPSVSATKFRHSVHPIDEIDVGAARRSEENARSLGDAASGMCGEIVDAEVGLNLDDAPGGCAMHNYLAQQVARHLHGVSRVKRFRKYLQPQTAYNVTGYSCGSSQVSTSRKQSKNDWMS